MAADKPREHPLVDAPATPAACKDDRDAAQGQGAATTQLGEARSHGNSAAGSR
ncbi:hypothetical protein OIE71_04645 [Streptomyces sp. NBC_01725]|uniref:hypothetical protein n=1 Tax=Streptomyces sp. NBC_01725 TaxID=2975923 RepID=UPI002E2A0421|nr:hypothetical protein [Streptomyces sp. NBC_01725]